MPIRCACGGGPHESTLPGETSDALAFTQPVSRHKVPMGRKMSWRRVRSTGRSAVICKDWSPSFVMARSAVIVKTCLASELSICQYAAGLANSKPPFLRLGSPPPANAIRESSGTRVGKPASGRERHHLRNTVLNRDAKSNSAIFIYPPAVEVRAAHQAAIQPGPRTREFTQGAGAVRFLERLTRGRKPAGARAQVLCPPLHFMFESCPGPPVQAIFGIRFSTGGRGGNGTCGSF